MPSYVLVVDDEPDAQEILRRIVSSLGLVAQAASDGYEALNLIGAESPSLVLLDLMMPNLDGFEVLTRMRAIPDTRYIPVIVVTACQPAQVEMFRLPGVSHVMQKGHFTAQSLRAIILTTLGIDPANTERGPTSGPDGANREAQQWPFLPRPDSSHHHR